MDLEELGYSLTEYEVEALEDDELQTFVELSNVFSREREPRHIDITAKEYVIFSNSPGRVRRRFVAKDSEGQPAAFLAVTHSDDGTSPNILGTSIDVVLEHRRKAVGSALLEKAAKIAVEMKRPLLSLFYFDTVPAGGAFADAIGAKTELEFHSNVVKVPDLDTNLLEEWFEQGPERAPGYSVIVAEGAYPDELLEGMAHLYLVLERDMPHPDTWEPREWSGEFVKQMMEHYLQGTDALTAIAIHNESGVPAGMSQLIRRHSDHTTWIVSTTMVDPDHRGFALGKWVKAAVNLDALERWPGAEWQETGNAFTNEAMLGINHAMGFEHEFTMTDAEVNVAQVENYLADRG